MIMFLLCLPVTNTFKFLFSLVYEITQFHSAEDKFQEKKSYTLFLMSKNAKHGDQKHKENMTNKNDHHGNPKVRRESCGFRK